MFTPFIRRSSVTFLAMLCEARMRIVEERNGRSIKGFFRFPF